MKKPTEYKYACRYGCGYSCTDPRPRGKHEHDKHGAVWTANGTKPETLPAPEPIAYPSGPAVAVDASRPLDLTKQALDQLRAREKKLTLDLQILETLTSELARTRRQIEVLTHAISELLAEPQPEPEAPAKTEAAAK